MKSRFTKSLQIKVFIGLGALLFGAVSIIFYINLLAQENHAYQLLHSQVNQLEVQGQAIKRRGTTYATYAPREYPHYFRDLKVFYPDFMHDLDAFENQIERISKTSKELPNSAGASSNIALTNSINNLNTNWKVFKKGFLSKLGTDLKEPRLEWGADYVKEKQDLIHAITGKLINTIDNTIKIQLEANKQLTNNTFIAASVLLLLGVVWFYFSVIRRITLTVKGCQRVAQGDFGYKLAISGNDELSALALAFNTLSARTSFVVTMLSKMHSEDSSENKVDMLYQEANGYLPIECLGLWQLNQSENCLDMLTFRSERPANTTLQKTLASITKNDQHLLDICNTYSAVKYDNLPAIVSSLPDAKLMREIMKMGLLNSVLIVPLRADDGWEGVLVYIAAELDAYSDEQLSLMKNLAPYIANGLSQAGKNPVVNPGDALTA